MPLTSLRCQPVIPDNFYNFPYNIKCNPIPEYREKLSSLELILIIVDHFHFPSERKQYSSMLMVEWQAGVRHPSALSVALVSRRYNAQVQYSNQLLGLGCYLNLSMMRIWRWSIVTDDDYVKEMLVMWCGQWWLWCVWFREPFII